MSENSAMDLPPGILIRSGSLVIDFRYRGMRCRETLKNLAPTKSNIKFAERKRSAILLEIAQGTFDYARHFPDSRRAAFFSGPTARRKTVATVLDEWLAVCETQLTPHTVRGYKNSVEKYVRPAFGQFAVTELHNSAIVHWINTELSHLAPRTISAILIPLKAVVKSAKADRLISYDPLIGIQPPSADYEEPDPFTRDEIDRITGISTYRQSEHNMVQFALWSGVRTSELIALAWEDVDLKAGIVRIRRAVSRDGYKVPKTRRSVRDIELLAPALEALQSQRTLSAVRPAVTVNVMQRNSRRTRPEKLRFVFHNTNTDKPFSDVGTYRDWFWYPLLKKAGVRARGSSNTRHTFISQMLTANMPKEWIVRQVGHTSPQTIDNHYGKWITEDALNMAHIANERFAFGHKAVTNKTDKEKTS